MDGDGICKNFLLWCNPVYFCFCFPWLRRYILKKIYIAKTNVKKCIAYIFSKKFYGFTSSTVFNSSCIQCSSVILAYAFVWVCESLSGFCYRPHRMNMEECHPLKFFGIVLEGLVLFSKYLVEFIWSLTFGFWEFVYCEFSFITGNWSVHIFYFFLVQSWEIAHF